MENLHAEIESSLNKQAHKLMNEGTQISEDSVEVLNNVIRPLFTAVQQGARQAGWNAEVSYAQIEPTVEIEIWPDHEEPSTGASVMAYPDSNDFIDSGLVMAYSIAGSNAVQASQPRPLDQCSPSNACSIIKKTIQEALGRDQSES